MHTSHMGSPEGTAGPQEGFERVLQRDCGQRMEWGLASVGLLGLLPAPSSELVALEIGYMWCHMQARRDSLSGVPSLFML